MYFLANSMTGIKDVLNEEPEEKGAYCCSYPSFLDVYRVVVRMGERSGIPSVLMVCTLESENSETPLKQTDSPRADALEEEMEIFRRILSEGIRRGDVYTRYSSRQFLALLVHAEEADGQKVAARLGDRWKAAGRNQGWNVNFIIQRTESPGKEECGNGQERHIYGADHQPGERYLAGAGYLA